jgi:hypothetical protein
MTIKLLNYSLFLSLFITQFISCGWIDQSSRSVFEPDATKKAPSRSQNLVSKNQYDQLMEKYRSVYAENQKLKEKLGISVKPIESEYSAVDSNTISINSDQTKIPGVIPSDKNNTDQNQQDDFQKDMMAYEQGLKNFEEKKFLAARKLFEQSSTSEFLQIKVRSKLYLGRTFMMEDQYDLALQMFDEVITSHAYSSYVFEALRFGAECAKKLKQETKFQEYVSLLQDVFKQSV